MKLRQLVIGEHPPGYWHGPILPDPYPPGHPSAPCYKCNQLCEEFVNWVEKLCRWMLFPTRRHRTRYLVFAGLLLVTMMALNSSQYPVTLEAHPIHSPHPDNSWRTFLTQLFGRRVQERRLSKRALIPDWVFAPNCEALMRGDSDEVHFTKRMLYREVRDKVTDTEYLVQTKSCPRFRAAEGYPTHALSVDEESFPMAYIIQGYKHAEQLHRLLKAVYAPQNPYCICTNHKATHNFDESIKAISGCFQNVFHVSTLRFNRTRGPTLSEVDDIKCARKCMKVLVNTNWKYLIKIHAQDYPLVTNQFIVSKLKSMERINANFISDYGHMQKKQTVKVLLSNSTQQEAVVTLWRASPFFVVSKGVVEQVMEHPLTYKLLPAVQQHEHPESYFWVSLILHIIDDSSHAAMVAANKHRIELQAHKEFHTKQYCAGITQLQDHCVMGVEDLAKLFHQRQHQFYAHAFDLDRDHVAYSCLEQRLEGLLLDQGANFSDSFTDPKIHASQPEINLKATIHENKTDNVEVESEPTVKSGNHSKADRHKVNITHTKEPEEDISKKKMTPENLNDKDTKKSQAKTLEGENKESGITELPAKAKSSNSTAVPDTAKRESSANKHKVHHKEEPNPQASEDKSANAGSEKTKHNGMTPSPKPDTPEAGEPDDANSRQRNINTQQHVQKHEQNKLEDQGEHAQDTIGSKKADNDDKEGAKGDKGNNVLEWLEERQKTMGHGVKDGGKHDAAVQDNKGESETRDNVNKKNEPGKETESSDALEED